MLKKTWIWFKSLWHACDFFRWEVGYGLTDRGIGRYEYKVCRDCGKEFGELINFKRDEELYKE